MKTFIAVLMLTAVAAQANTIKGTMVKTGSIKSQTYVRGAQVKCSAKIDGKGLFGGKSDVQNLLQEDQFGNPAYKVNVTIELKSKDRDIVDLKFKERITFTNLHASGVSDVLYKTLTPEAPAPTASRPNPVASAKGSEAEFMIDDSGNITRLRVNTNVGPVSCTF